MATYGEMKRTELPPDFWDQPAGPTLPPDMPDRTPQERRARRRQLEPTNGRLHDLLRSELPDFTYHIWIRELTVIDAAGGRLWLSAPTHTRTWVIERYQRLLAGAASAAAGRPITVAIVPAEAMPAEQAIAA